MRRRSRIAPRSFHLMPESSTAIATSGRPVVVGQAVSTPAASTTRRRARRRAPTGWSCWGCRPRGWRRTSSRRRGRSGSPRRGAPGARILRVSAAREIGERGRALPVGGAASGAAAVPRTRGRVDGERSLPLPPPGTSAFGWGELASFRSRDRLAAHRPRRGDTCRSPDVRPQVARREAVLPAGPSARRPAPPAAPRSVPRARRQALVEGGARSSSAAKPAARKPSATLRERPRAARAQARGPQARRAQVRGARERAQARRRARLPRGGPHRRARPASSRPAQGPQLHPRDADQAAW